MVVLFICMPATNSAMSRCCDQGTPFERAIINSDFRKVKRMLSSPEIAPLVLNEAKTLAKNICEQRIHYVNNPLSSNDTVKKGQMGACYFSIGLFSLINIIIDMKLERETESTGSRILDGCGALASLLAIYQGAKIMLDPVFQWSENDRLARAVAIEQLLKEKTSVSAPA